MNSVSPLQKVDNSLLKAADIKLYIKRDDLIHPLISGNKWRKLKYNIQDFKENNKRHLLSFGGAFSNHLLALAAISNKENIPASILVRGDGFDPSNQTLVLAKKLGLNMHFVSRQEYKLRHDADYQKAKLSELNCDYLIPEGGTNDMALKGCGEIIGEIKAQLGYHADLVALAAGTGGTSAGLLKSSQGSNILTFPALKGGFLKDDILKLAGENQDMLIFADDYHFGGYVKFNDELIDFIKQFHSDFNILLDPIYTSKMMFGLFDMIEKGLIKKGSTVVAIHTGGLQGNFGFNYRFGNKIPNPDYPEMKEAL